MRLERGRRYALCLALALPGALAAQQQGGTVDGADAIRVLLAPEAETTLVSQMEGRIVSLEARLGQRVARGTPIVVFDCSEAQARLRMASADLAAARESLSAKSGLKALNAAGSMEVALAGAAVERAQGAVALGRAQIGYCSVSAPFDGRIAGIYVKQHQGVASGAALVDMVSDGPLKLRLNVPSVYLRELKVGTPFSVRVNETGETYAARVVAINARVDAVAQTIEIEGRIDSSAPGLLGGMSGIARFSFKP